MKYSFKSKTHVGKVRSANEDNLGEAITPNGHLFIVCDGMGGHVGGAVASGIAVNSILEFFQREVYDNLIQAIDHSLSFANEQIFASALNNPDLKGMGTTAVLLLIKDEECFIGHVGDSRIYLYSNNILNRITKDHSFVQTLVDNGIIDDEDAENHPNKNRILQALGIASIVKSTVCQLSILPKASDIFLLCSDGLNGMVSDKDIHHIIQEDNLSVCVENLITAALNGGGTDNITATLVLIEESPHLSSRFTDFNPRPRGIDLATNNDVDSATDAPAKKNRKLIYYSIGVALLVAICIVIWFFGLSSNTVKNTAPVGYAVKDTKYEEYLSEKGYFDAIDKKYYRYFKTKWQTKTDEKAVWGLTNKEDTLTHLTKFFTKITPPNYKVNK